MIASTTSRSLGLEHAEQGLDMARSAPIVRTLRWMRWRALVPTGVWIFAGLASVAQSLAEQADGGRLDQSLARPRRS